MTQRAWTQEEEERVQRRLMDADWGQTLAGDDPGAYLMRGKLDGSEPLRDIAISLRQIVILLDAIRRRG